MRHGGYFFNILLFFLCSSFWLTRIDSHSWIHCIISPLKMTKPVPVVVKQNKNNNKTNYITVKKILLCREKDGRKLHAVIDMAIPLIKTRL